MFLAVEKTDYYGVKKLLWNEKMTKTVFGKKKLKQPVPLIEFIHVITHVCHTLFLFLGNNAPARPYAYAHTHAYARKGLLTHTLFHIKHFFPIRLPLPRTSI